MIRAQLLILSMLLVASPAFPVAQYKGCPGVVLQFSVNPRALRPRFLDFLWPGYAQARASAKELLAAVENDPGRSLILSLQFAEAFFGGKFDEKLVINTLGAIEAGMRPWRNGNIDILAHPRFSREFRERNGFALEDLDRQLRVASPSFSWKQALDAADPVLAKKPSEYLPAQTEVLKHLTPELQRRVGLVLREMVDYSFRREADYQATLEAGRAPTWDIMIAVPSGFDHVDEMGNVIPVFPPGTTLVRGNRKWFVIGVLGNGGEHVVYLVRGVDGRDRVIKVGGFVGHDKIEEQKRIASAGLPVMRLEEISPSYFLTDRFAHTGIDDLLSAIDQKKPSAMKDYVDLYRTYLSGKSLVTDLQLDNLARMPDGTVQISDWVVAVDVAPDQTIKRAELSAQLARSFLAVVDKRARVLRRLPDAQWMAEARQQLAGITDELGLRDARSIRGIDLGFSFTAAELIARWHHLRWMPLRQMVGVAL